MRFGKETKVKALGREWTLGRTTVAIIEALRDAVAERVGDPFASPERFGPRLAPEKAFELFKEADAVARQLAMFSLGCPLAEQFLATELGGATYVHLLLQQKHPDATMDTALAILEEIGTQEAARKLAQTQGRGPAGNGHGPEAPAPPGAAPAEAPATSPA